jgi:hypothetical protein
MPSETTIHEVADGVYRVATPVRFPNGTDFSFNQYLMVDEAPLLFHTGLRRMFPSVREAVARVLPVERLRYIAFSHFEADECGSLNEWLAAAPEAAPLCGRIAAMTSINDVADRTSRVLGDGEALRLGQHTVRWLDTPHMPHAWECGMLYEDCTRTLFLQRSFHPERPRPCADHGERHSRAQRGHACPDGLLRAFDELPRDSRPSRRARAAHARLHAWQRVAWRGRGPTAGAGGHSRSGACERRRRAAGEGYAADRASSRGMTRAVAVAVAMSAPSESSSAAARNAVSSTR